ncbi:MAG: DUF1922 domain-containing protein [Aigarchaeota archaeon]|nr:DUF1922 domain-containing protein [Aigarchaeota archaeon]MCX8193315.1 DUF1922 domain-containing protein [Nitrososphaeria archaeon]MDW7986534.1 DUF1922 domain-containing protein [Nitrososphaerota archaeon]
MEKHVYKIVVCNNCGHLQITSAKATYRCFRCGRIVKIDQDRILFKHKDPSKAREKLISLKSAKERDKIM